MINIRRVKHASGMDTAGGIGIRTRGGGSVEYP
jgi:hypothetical protein